MPRLWIKSVFALLVVYILYKVNFNGQMESSAPQTLVIDSDNHKHEYSSAEHPFIFIGGHPRSGTTLMRALLDSHSWVRCGEETRLVPRILKMRDDWITRTGLVDDRLLQAGIGKSLIDSAVAAFILEVIAKHGKPAKVLCNKDPLVLSRGTVMTSLFPKSKWLFMMRDGRAVIHSAITRKVNITGYDFKDPRQCLEKWNNIVADMGSQCNEIGPERCMIVYYEQLVLHPERWMTIILDFLGLPWDKAVLHHQDFINKKGDNGIRVSLQEPSSDQIVKPINVEALTQWAGHYPEDVIRDMAEIAPMLSKFGYNPKENPPNYGVPDGHVINNTQDVQKNHDFWEARAKLLVKEMEKKKDEVKR